MGASLDVLADVLYPPLGPLKEAEPDEPDTHLAGAPWYRGVCARHGYVQGHSKGPHQGSGVSASGQVERFKNESTENVGFGI